MREPVDPRLGVSYAAVLFMDILGFQGAVDSGPNAIRAVYELLSFAFNVRLSPRINAYIAVSDSLIVSTEMPGDALEFALQIFLNFFLNLDGLAKPGHAPVLLRGGLSYDWLTTPFAATRSDAFLHRGGTVNLVGKAYSDAYCLSEKVANRSPGALLRISAPAYAHLSHVSAVQPKGTSFYELDWAAEVFRENHGRAIRMIRNVRGCMEQLRQRPELFGSLSDAAKGHWRATLELLKKAAANLQVSDSGIKAILSEPDPLL